MGSANELKNVYKFTRNDDQISRFTIFKISKTRIKAMTGACVTVNHFGLLASSEVLTGGAF